MQLTIRSAEGAVIYVDLPEDERERTQQLIKFELRDGRGQVLDVLHIQLELTKEKRDTTKQVLDRMASREAPFTRIRIR